MDASNGEQIVKLLAIALGQTAQLNDGLEVSLN
jgi:hypothetical protein